MVVGFERAGIGVVAAVETAGAPLWCEDRPRSISSPGVTEWSCCALAARRCASSFRGALTVRLRIGEGLVLWRPDSH